MTKTIEILQTGSIIIGGVSAIKAGASIQDTEFNFQNIKELIETGVLEGCDDLKNFICKSVNEIVNVTDYLKKNFDIPFPKYEDKPLIEIEKFKGDISQLIENIDIINDYSPEKIENIFTILVSMGVISSVFILLIPYILQKIKPTN